MIRLVLALLVACVAALLPSAAHAHAGLTDSSPRDGASLEALPDEVTLTFTEDITPPAHVVVRAADGTTLAQGEASVDGPVVRQVVDSTEAGGPGDYTLAYSVVSADGHRVTGELSFVVEGPGPEEPEPSATPTPTPVESATEQPGEEPTPTETGGASVAAEEDEGPLVANGMYLLLGVGLLLVIGIVVVAAKRRRAD